jgi:hypothetical protein
MQSSIRKQHLRRLCKLQGLRRFLFAQQGYAIAELAIVLPALIVFASGLLSVLGLGAEQIALNAHCAEITRIIARGDEIPSEITSELNLDLEVQHENGLVIVELTKSKEYSMLGIKNVIKLNAKASALDEVALL